MSDRLFLLLFSALMIFGSLAATVWLVISGQALTVDGLFLVLVLLLIAAAFALYLKFLMGKAMEAAQAASQPAKPEKPAAKPAPATVSES
jgi:hypothetical protein